MTYERADEVREVVTSLEQTCRSDYALTLVDNHSGPEVQALLRSLRERHPTLRVIRNFENRYCGGASNQALRLSRAPYAIYLCAHECFPIDPGWDVRCLEFMEAHPRVAQAGHLIASPAYADGQGYMGLETFEHFRNREYARKRADELFFHVQGGFYVLRMEAFHKSGGFNPKIPHGHMDVELSYFLESEGWEIADLPFVRSIHRNTRPKLEGYDPAHAVYHPLTPAEAERYRSQRDQQERAGRFCPACGWRGPRLLDDESADPGGADSRCPACGSLEWHRAVALELSGEDLTDLRVLDLSRSPLLGGFVRQRGARYWAAGSSSDADLRADVARMPFGAGGFDLVLCSDLLDWVSDDRAVVRELHRLLGSGGRALVQVRQSPYRRRTIEREGPGDDPGPVREPGRDYALRLEHAGLRTSEWDLGRGLPLEERVLHGIYQGRGGACYLLERDATPA